jgi:hypothetical protein
LANPNIEVQEEGAAEPFLLAKASAAEIKKGAEAPFFAIRLTLD